MINVSKEFQLLMNQRTDFKENAEITLADDTKVKVRLIDCVGFMVEGASGHMEGNANRMVKTPWFPDAVPFVEAAEIGTQKVIKDHSTIGIVITTDGTIGEFSRENYYEAEEKAINELKKINKPFIILLNCVEPTSDDAIKFPSSVVICMS